MTPFQLAVLADHRTTDVPAYDGRGPYGRAQRELYRKHYLKRAPPSAARACHPPAYRASALGIIRLARAPRRR